MNPINLTKPIASVFALLLLSLTGPASVQATTLWEVYKKALSNDPTYLSAIASKQQQQQDVEIAATNFWPGLTLNGGYSRSESSTTDATSKYYTYSAILGMDLYSKTNNVASSRAKTVFLKAEFDFKSAQQDLIYRVADAYFAVLVARDNVEFSKAEQRAISRQLDQTKQRFDVGLVAITDVHEAQARYDLSVAQGIKFENDLGVALEALREITGTTEEDLYGLGAEAPMLRPNPEDIDQWVKIALKENPLLNSSQLSVDLALHDKDAIRAANYPNVSLNITYSGNEPVGDTLITTGNPNNPVSAEGTSTTSGSVNLSYNFWDAGATREKVKKSVFSIEKTKQDNEKARRDVQRRTRSAYLDVIAGVSRIAALKQAVVSRESAQKAAEAGFEVGTKTTVDVLDSRRELFSAQNEYAKARYNFILNRLNLKIAAGTLNEKDLKQVDDWLVATPLKQNSGKKK